MKVITFIGTGNYQSCKYQFNGEECETHLFPVAVSKFFKPSEMLVFLTDEARSAKCKFFDGKIKTAQEIETEYYKNIEEIHKLKFSGQTYFQQLCEINKNFGFVTPRDIPIASGKSEPELWEIFDSISSNLGDNDEIVFDITHAFRSIPVLSFLIIAFLRETKHIKLKAIIYGAFEAQNRATKETPVFDLTPFVELLDWMSATKQFKKNGDADFLVALLKDKGFESLADKIGSISDGLKLLRPGQVMDGAFQLSKEVENAKSVMSDSSKPFVELIETVKDRYKTFALTNEKERLKKELALAKWYFDNGLPAQSLILLREWVVSLVCMRFELDAFSREFRTDSERILNGETVEINSVFRSLDKIENGALLGEGWREIIKFRNDLSHAGYVKKHKSHRQITAGVKKIFERYVRI